MSDELLMVSVKEGQLDKMSVLFERYKKPMYAFFYRMSFSQSQSEDLTQNVFERVIRYRSSFKPQNSFKSWIYQIARNVRADYYRQNKLKYSEEQSLQELQIASASFLEKMDYEEQLQNLEQALSKLNDEQREILLLTRFQKLKYAEVAQLMNCTEGAVKVKVHRAIQHLRKVFFKIDIL